jgi:hypothetical protein
MNRIRTAALAVVAAGTVASVWEGLVETVPRSDFTVFLTAAHHVLSGRDPYPHVPSAAVYRGNAFVYPWLTAHLFVPFALLPLRISLPLYFLLSCSAILLACRVARLPQTWSALIVLTSATAVRGLQVGAINAFLLLGCTLAWAWRERPGRVGALLALVIGAKLFLAPLLLWLVIARRWRALAASLAGLVVFLGAGFVLGPIGPRRYLQLLSELSGHEDRQGFSFYRLLTDHVDSTGARVLSVAIAVGLVLVVVVRRPRVRERDLEATVFGAAVVAALLSTPILWSHYLLLAFLPLMAARAGWVAFAIGSALDWLIAAPAHVRPLLPHDFQDRLTLLWTVLVLMVLLLRVRAVSGGVDGRATTTVVRGTPPPRGRRSRRGGGHARSGSR